MQQVSLFMKHLKYISVVLKSFFALTCDCAFSGTFKPCNLQIPKTQNQLGIQNIGTML